MRVSSVKVSSNKSRPRSQCDLKSRWQQIRAICSAEFVSLLRRFQDYMLCGSLLIKTSVSWMIHLKNFTLQDTDCCCCYLKKRHGSFKCLCQCLGSHPLSATCCPSTCPPPSHKTEHPGETLHDSLGIDLIALVVKQSFVQQRVGSKFKPHLASNEQEKVKSDYLTVGLRSFFPEMVADSLNPSCRSCNWLKKKKKSMIRPGIPSLAPCSFPYWFLRCNADFSRFKLIGTILSDRLHMHTPARALGSTSQLLLDVSIFKINIKGVNSFSLCICMPQTFPIFKSLIKSHHFSLPFDSRTVWNSIRIFTLGCSYMLILVWLYSTYKNNISCF